MRNDTGYLITRDGHRRENQVQMSTAASSLGTDSRRATNSTAPPSWWQPSHLQRPPDRVTRNCPWSGDHGPLNGQCPTCSLPSRCILWMIW